jgi:predicted RNase H-like HicB family nuclease
MMQETWKVTTIRHRETGLYVAMSDDLPGFYAHGRSVREIEERIPQAIKMILEASGKTVGEITKCEGEGEPSGFEPIIAKYALETCNA